MKVRVLHGPLAWNAPLLASRADTGEALHVRMRKGQAASPRGVVRFADELIARVKRAGASGEKLFRADSAVWNRKLVARLQHAGWSYSISVRLQFWVPGAIAQIPETAWQPKRRAHASPPAAPAPRPPDPHRPPMDPPLPARWPWHHDFIRALARIPALPAAA